MPFQTKPLFLAIFPLFSVRKIAWHIPSDAEWTTLTNYVGGVSDAGSKLKATSGWNAHATYGNGSDAHGFSALPGGYGNSVVDFYVVGLNGYWWSSTENDANGAWLRSMNYNYGNVTGGSNGKTYLFSVRCVQD
ncbi:MAG: hypothetical protein FWB90_04435 [Fibromonadales bacterium]|nr:hypothetical protein [Fibromonadales bacterium]